MKLRMRPAGAILLLAGLSACDIPSGLPRWETSWVAPVEEVSVGVAEVLPSGVEVNADTSAFLLTFDTVSEQVSLGEMCSLCPPGSAVLPKPAFQYTAQMTVPFVAQVESATIQGGSLVIDLLNGFDFDPIRPGAASDSGTIVIEVRSGAQLVADFEIDGRGRTFPPGQVLKVVMAFADAEVGDSLSVNVIIDSPAGDATTVDTSDELSIDVYSDGIEVSEVVLDLGSEPVSADSVELDLSGVDISDRIQEGVLFLEIDNPFGVAGTLQLSIDPPGDGAAIVKPVPLIAGASEVEIAFSESEIQQIAGQENVVTLTGNVGGNNVTIRPDMVLTLATRLLVTVEVGGDMDEDEG